MVNTTQPYISTILKPMMGTGTIMMPLIKLTHAIPLSSEIPTQTDYVTLWTEAKLQLAASISSFQESKLYVFSACVAAKPISGSQSSPSKMMLHLNLMGFYQAP